MIKDDFLSPALRLAVAAAPFFLSPALRLERATAAGPVLHSHGRKYRYDVSPSFSSEWDFVALSTSDTQPNPRLVDVTRVISTGRLDQRAGRVTHDSGCARGDRIGKQLNLINACLSSYDKQVRRIGRWPEFRQHRNDYLKCSLIRDLACRIDNFDLAYHSSR